MPSSSSMKLSFSDSQSCPQKYDLGQKLIIFPYCFILFIYVYILLWHLGGGGGLG